MRQLQALLASSASRVGVITLALFASACAPELNWREVKAVQADGLLALFPCKPEQHERTLRWPGVSRDVRLHVLSCQAMEGTWALSYATLDDVTEVGSALRGLAEALRANLAAASGAVPPAAGVISQDLGGVKVPGMTLDPDARAWRHQAERPDGLGRPLRMDVQAWHFSHGLTVFQGSVWRPQEQVNGQSGEDVANTFFHSFQFPG